MSIVDNACQNYPEACKKANAASISLAQQTMAASKVVVDAIQYDNLESVTNSAIQYLGDFTSMGSEFIDSKLRKLWLCFIGILGSGLVGYASFPLLINILGLTLKGPFTKKLFKIFENYGWVKKSIF